VTMWINWLRVGWHWWCSRIGVLTVWHERKRYEVQGLSVRIDIWKFGDGKAEPGCGCIQNIASRAVHAISEKIIYTWIELCMRVGVVWVTSKNWGRWNGVGGIECVARVRRASLSCDACTERELEQVVLTWLRVEAINHTWIAAPWNWVEE
jgi:hypothetical protein